MIRTSSMELTEELHMIRAHLLHYSSLVVAFREIVLFILETPNPALTPEQKSISTPLLKRECKALLLQIERLDEEHKAQEGRLMNVIELVSTPNDVYCSCSHPSYRYSAALIFLRVGP